VTEGGSDHVCMSVKLGLSHSERKRGCESSKNRVLKTIFRP